MRKNVNKAIRNLIKSNIEGGEIPRIESSDETVSALSLLVAGRDRYFEGVKFLLDNLGEDFEFVKDSHFTSNCHRKGAIGVGLACDKIGEINCKKPLAVNINYEDGELALSDKKLLVSQLKRSCRDISKAEEEVKSLEELLIEDNRELFVNAANFGLEKGYDIETVASTMSQDFVVTLACDKFKVSLASGLLDLLKKEVHLNYRYGSDQFKMFAGESPICTTYGIFSLQSNVPGLKNDFTYAWDCYQADRGIIKLLETLRVDVKQLPEFIINNVEEEEKVYEKKI